MDKLRKKYNPEGSILRKQQLRMLELLDFVDSICKQHNIAYWLDSGTLLGAARHKGFIPWDDDLDIQMQRKDYKRFVRLMSNISLPQNIVLQSRSTDKKYIFPYIKIRDTQSVIKETHEVDFEYNGIFLDVFPLERNNMQLQKISYSLYKPFYHLFRNKKYQGKWAKKAARTGVRLIDSLIIPIFRGISFILNPQYRTHTYGLNYYRKRYDNEIFPLQEITFEGKLYPCPCNVDMYLTRLYGDYMQLPDKIEVHINEIEFRE